MDFRYPYQAERDGDSQVVSFPDVPGALTQVDPGEDFEATVRDCLVAALGGYVEHRLPAPAASPLRGRAAITLDVMTSAKLALATVMAGQGVSNVALARRLGVNEKVVRRLLDLDHASQINRLVEALASLGKMLQVSVRMRLPGTRPGLR
jgi:antitoxin HicB